MKDNQKKTSNQTLKNKKKARKVLYFVSLFALYFFIMYFKQKTGENANVETITPTVTTEEAQTEEQTTTPTTNTDSLEYKLEVQFIDVGQADCILIRINDESMLIDAGNNADGKKLVAYFKELGITEFEYVVGTHAHEDHIGGMDDIIDNFDIGTFYMPSTVTTTKTYEDVLDSLEAKNYYLDTPEIGDTFNLENAKIKVVYVGDNDKELNDCSIVLRMDYGEISYLFTGDASTNVEEEILSSNEDIDVDILKVGHHGSRYSSSEEFLDAVTPDYAFIEVGKNNKYNHPTTEIIERLKENGIEIHRTDEEGTLITETDGKVLTLRSERTDTDGN